MPPMSYLSGGGGGVVHGEGFGPESEPEPDPGQSQNPTHPYRKPPSAGKYHERKRLGLWMVGPPSPSVIVHTAMLPEPAGKRGSLGVARGRPCARAAMGYRVNGPIRNSPEAKCHLCSLKSTVSSGSKLPLPS